MSASAERISAAIFVYCISVPPFLHNITTNDESSNGKEVIPC